MLSKELISTYKKAGIIANTCLHKGAKLIKVGASAKDVVDKVEEEIIKMGGKPAFPAQIALNSVAAHYCPTDEDDVIFKEGDIAKIDIGVHMDGHVADNAVTVNLGDHDELSKASKDALNQALKIIRPSVTLAQIGKTIQETIQSYGFSPVKNLSGHGLGHFNIHTKPSIPNFNTHDQTQLKEDQIIAIEPFATTGAGIIYESNNPTIFSAVASRPSRSPITRKVFKSIQQFQGLPFTTRWLTREHGLGKVRFALKELQALGNIIAHPPLPDKDGGFVSQHEHSVIVAEKPIVYTKLTQD